MLRGTGVAVHEERSRSVPPQWAWGITGIGVSALWSIGGSLMSGTPSAHEGAIIAFVLAALWLGGITTMWFRNIAERDWTVWLRAIGVLAIVSVVTPLLIYLALPTSAQVAPSGVGGNCNNFGNNNFNCNTFNLGPSKPAPRHLTVGQAAHIKRSLDGKRLSVLVINAGGDGARRYASEIKSAFAADGQKVLGFSIENATPPFYGLAIIDPSRVSGGDTLLKILKSSGLQVRKSNAPLPIPASILSRYSGMVDLVVGLNPKTQTR